MTTEKTVRTLALGLPETSEKPCYGTPGFYVRKKLFARILPDPRILAVRVDLEEREALLSVAPEVFFVTPHYQGWPMVLIRLPKIARAELAERLVEAWRFVAPAKLSQQLDDESLGT
ncbi:MAG TPA: MmcQ/YjbR family DNA-binding protein [Myxococcota bacterium]|nr:MmcQ/YjbR family DNA-binding protein [Myxococcota bacterium]